MSNRQRVTIRHPRNVCFWPVADITYGQGTSAFGGQADMTDRGLADLSEDDAVMDKRYKHESGRTNSQAPKEKFRTLGQNRSRFISRNYVLDHLQRGSNKT